jgi:hypothetical protein
MTLEQALLAALSVVSGIVVVISKLLWNEAIECKTDRAWLREEMEKLREQLGLSTGRLEAVDHCPQASCPFNKSARVGAAVVALMAACLFSGCATAPSGVSLGWEGDLAGVPVRASYNGGKASVIIDRRVTPTK